MSNERFKSSWGKADLYPCGRPGVYLGGVYLGVSLGILQVVVSLCGFSKSLPSPAEY